MVWKKKKDCEKTKCEIIDFKDFSTLSNTEFKRMNKKNNE